MLKDKNIHPCQKVWEGMMRRCYSEKHQAYHRYGGRGISVCKEWHDKHVFFEWAISNGWERGLQLDRIDNDGIYSPENCRIVDSITNANNKSNNHMVFVHGEWLTLTQAAVKYNILKTTLRYRVSKLGLTGDEIVKPMMRSRTRTTDARGKKYE
jgi:hypothetical protein